MEWVNGPNECISLAIMPHFGVTGLLLSEAAIHHPFRALGARPTARVLTHKVAPQKNSPRIITPGHPHDRMNQLKPPVKPIATANGRQTGSPSSPMRL